MKNKGRFTKKNASEMGRRGGLKVKRRRGREYFVALAKRRWRKAPPVTRE